MTDITKILKPGAVLVADKIEMTPELEQRIKRVQEEQLRVLELKKVDVERLRRTVITI